MKNIMLDIETMGNTSQAAIISIASVYFDSTGLGKTFYKKVNLQSSCAAGLKMDPDTVLWWMDQSDEARAEFKTKGDPLYFVLKQLRDFISVDSFIWGKGSDFDNVILKNAFLSANFPIPWNHKNNRCFRTLQEMFPNIPMRENLVKHNALEDAKWQAEYAIKALKVLEAFNNSIYSETK